MRKQIKEIIEGFLFGIVIMLLAVSATKACNAQVSMQRFGMDTVIVLGLEEAQTIDYWAWKGIRSVDAINLSERLVEQVSNVSLMKDSLLINQQKQLADTQGKMYLLERENTLVKANLIRTTALIVDLEEKNKVCRKENRKLKITRFLYALAAVAGGILTITSL